MISCFKRLLLIISVIFFAAFNTFCQKQFPVYKDVVEKFFRQYDLPENISATQIHFIKKANGYSVVVIDKTSHQNISKHLFWSLEKRRFQKLEYFDKNAISEDDAIEELLTSFEAELFDLYPFYGYINWYTDVIEFYNKKNTLTNEELYGLGRAYSNAASSLLNNSKLYVDSSNMFVNSEVEKNQLTGNQLDKYKYFRHKAVECFSQLCTKNGEYKNAVGNICNTRDNEVMTGFLELLIYQNHEVAKNELSQPMYDNIFSELAKKYLSCCDSNAILFTFGDNDTFPLLYLQSKGFRNDVLVINLYLLKNNNYINHLRSNTTFNADSIKITLPADYYSGNKMQVIPIRSQTRKSISFNSLLQYFIWNKDKANDENYFIEFPSHNLSINIDSTFEIPINFVSNYISKDQFIALDIIQSNLRERPIYFTDSFFPGLDNMEINGYVYKLNYNVNCTDKTLDNECIEQELTRKMVYESFDLELLSDNDKTYRKELVILQKPFIYLASYYAATKQKDSCAAVIERYSNLFPHNIVERNYTVLPLIEAAFKLNLQDNVDELSGQVLDNLLIKTETEQLDKNKTRLIEYTLRELEKYNQGNEDSKLKILRIRTRI